MNTQSTKVHTNSNPFLLMTLLVFASGAVVAQVPVDENGKPIASLAEESYPQGESLEDSAPLSSTELEELVGPIALYPDDLLAIVLPASTYPLEIVQAARFLQQLESDSSLKPDESWDESVTALVNYPEVVQMMDDDIDWTWRLGEAVISQQAGVIAAVELFRDRAYAAGNLKSDEYQTVSLDEGAIEIEPADEEIIYVPYYEPAEVVVYQPQPVYHYYPRAYPVYYYPYPVGHHFASGYFWGVTTAFTIGWSNHYLHVYHPSYFGHPYYGHHYYGHYYRRPSVHVYNNYYVNNSYRTSQYNHRDGDYWRPRQRSGSRPYSSNNRPTRVATTAGNRRDRSNSRTPAQRNQTGIQFRERRGNDTVRPSATRSRPAADNTRRGQQAPVTTRRVASNSQAAPVRANNTGSNQRRATSANTRQTAPARAATRRQSERVVAQRSPTRPAAQRTAPRPQRVAAPQGIVNKGTKPRAKIEIPRSITSDGLPA